MRKFGIPAAIGAAATAMVLVFPAGASAHCDTLDGPVVKAARTALAARDLTPVLRWVRPEDEAEIRVAFDRTLRVRQAGADAQALADQFFFETLVRVHRLGEGAPYLGLQPAGQVEPAIALADRAVETGSADAIVAELAAVVTSGLRTRFTEVSTAARRADTSVEAGRALVAAYVDFIHYAERVHLAAASAVEHHQAPSAHK